MRTTRLGSSDQQVPAFCLGAMFFGTTTPAATAHDLLDHAVDRGLTSVDPANNYAFWVDGATGDESELTLGAWFAARGPGARERITLATKVGARPRPGGQSLDDALGLSAATVAEQVDGSLRRLGVDHVDLLYAHIDDQATPLSETVGALGDVVRAGKARAVAGSNLGADRLRAALAVGDPDGRYVALQQRATYLTPAPGADFGIQVSLDDATQHTATDLGVTVLGYSALLGGAYNRTDRPFPEQYRHPGADRQLAALGGVAAELEADPGQVVLAWLAAHGVVPLLGVSSTAQLDAALAEITLTPAQLARLDAART